MNHVQRGTHWRIYTIGGRLACAVSAARAWQTSRTLQFVKCTQQRNCTVCVSSTSLPQAHGHTLAHTLPPHSTSPRVASAWTNRQTTGRERPEQDQDAHRRWRWCVVGLVCWKGSCTHTHGRPSSPSVYHHHRKPIHLSHSHTHSLTHARTHTVVSLQPVSIALAPVPFSGRVVGCVDKMDVLVVLTCHNGLVSHLASFLMFPAHF
jgi:hypothetical protein